MANGVSMADRTQNVNKIKSMARDLVRSASTAQDDLAVQRSLQGAFRFASEYNFTDELLAYAATVGLRVVLK